MSSRSLAAARARRAGDPVPPVSGNRPVTSIGSQAAFAQQLPPHMSYNTPPPPNNVRIQQPHNQKQQQQQQQHKSQYNNRAPPPVHEQPQTNGLPFSKLSISDAIGLVTLRLGRVEQWIMDTDAEERENEHSDGGVPTNHTIIDNAVLSTIVNRIDSLEKNTKGNNNVGGMSLEQTTKLNDEINEIKTQLKKIGDDVNKHTIEMSKNNESIFKFNRDLIETKDILKTFMIKYDMFASETVSNFKDYEFALSELEKRLTTETDDSPLNINDTNNNNDDNSSEVKTDTITDNTVVDSTVEKQDLLIASEQLKNIIKQEFI